MLIQERQLKILEILRQYRAATIKELRDALYISEATLRRDLTKMEQRGLIQRTHGGAVLAESSTDESPIIVREQKQIKEKKRIAQECLKFVHRSSSIFIDSSSTAGHLLNILSNIHGLTIITNGLNNALIASSNTSANVYLTSGIVFSKTNSVLGSDTIEYLNKFNADIFIFSCSGLSLNNGVMEVSFEQRQVKSTMLKNSKLHILLADYTKFDKIYMTRTCGFEEIDIIITDRKPSEDYIRLFEKHNVKVIVSN